MRALTARERALFDQIERQGSVFVHGADVATAKRLARKTERVEVEDYGRLGPGGNADGERWLASIKPRLIPHGCRVLRCCLVKHGTLDMAAGDLTRSDVHEWEVRPCGIPLFKDDAKETAVCSSCLSGWTHPENFAIEGPVPRDHYFEVWDGKSTD
jgi:hypothetical protein